MVGILPRAAAGKGQGLSVAAGTGQWGGKKEEEKWKGKEKKGAEKGEKKKKKLTLGEEGLYFRGIYRPLNYSVFNFIKIVISYAKFYSRNYLLGSGQKTL